MYGGYINLGPGPQYFSCVPGTHEPDIDAPKPAAGFVMIPPEHQAEMASRLIRVEIPVGHMVIFNGDIIHAISGGTWRHPEPLMRLFIGFRLSKGTDEPLIPDLATRLHNQDIIPRKSGQDPVMWPKLWWTNHRDKLEEFSRNFYPEYLTEVTVQSGKCEGDVHTIVPRHMGPLSPMSRYAPYTVEEQTLYWPNDIKIVKYVVEMFY